MQQDYPSKTQGFTIIEVIVAVFIISITVVGGVMGFSNVLVLLGEVRDTSTADRLAQQTMEELRAATIPFDDPTDRYDTDVSPAAESIFPLSELTTGLTEVTVTVTWTSRTGQNKSRSLVTYFTENGITKN